MKKVMYVTTVVLTLVVAATACAKKKGTENMNKVRNEKVLVAYYSATGTTEGVAKMIATATGGEPVRHKTQGALHGHRPGLDGKDLALDGRE